MQRNYNNVQKLSILRFYSVDLVRLTEEKLRAKFKENLYITKEDLEEIIK